MWNHQQFDLLSAACLSKTNQREVIVEECICLPAWFLIKPQHDAPRQLQGVQPSAIANLFAGLVQECHLQLWVSAAEDRRDVFFV